MTIMETRIDFENQTQCRLFDHEGRIRKLACLRNFGARLSKRKLRVTYSTKSLEYAGNKD